jgi:hypothetical protein
VTPADLRRAADQLDARAEVTDRQAAGCQARGDDDGYHAAYTEGHRLRTVARIRRYEADRIERWEAAS